MFEQEGLEKIKIKKKELRRLAQKLFEPLSCSTPKFKNSARCEQHQNEEEGNEATDY